jgi:hypothetical protein
MCIPEAVLFCNPMVQATSIIAQRATGIVTHTHQVRGISL